MNKIALLLLAHKTLEQVKRIITIFDKNKFDFYIHVDSKCNELIEILKDDNVYFVKRSSITWGSNQMNYVMIDLLNEAYFNNTYSHYIFMSGQCYPIKNSLSLYEYLSNNLEYSFIDFFDYENNYKYQKRTECYYYDWMNKNNFFIKVIKNMYMILTGGKNYTFSIFKRKKAKNINFVFGSQWITLSKYHAKYVLDNINKDNYLKYFDHALCSDECAIHTLVLMSPNKDKIRPGLTYVDFNGQSRSPKTLTVNDYDSFINSKKFFARKFDIKVDIEVLDKIDMELK